MVYNLFIHLFFFSCKTFTITVELRSLEMSNLWWMLCFDECKTSNPQQISGLWSGNVVSIAVKSGQNHGPCFNTLRLRQDSQHFPDNFLKCIFLNKNIWILINISLKFVPKGQINNIPALVQIMAWCRPGDKPLSEPVMVNLLMHISSVAKKLSWLIRHLSGGLCIFYSNLWNLSSDISV